MLSQVDMDEHKILWMLRKNRKYRGKMLYTFHNVCFRLTRRLRSKRNFSYLCHITLMITISTWTSNLSFCYLHKSVDFEIFLSHLIFILSWCLKCKIKLARKILCFLKISFKWMNVPFQQQLTMLQTSFSHQYRIQVGDTLL